MDSELELTSFQRTVFQAVREIPRWGCSTYGEVAIAAGHAGAARAVGSALAKNPWHYDACHDEEGYLLDKRYVPCHRVVPAGYVHSEHQSKNLPYLGRKDDDAVAKRKELMREGL